MWSLRSERAAARVVDLAVCAWVVGGLVGCGCGG